MTNPAHAERGSTLVEILVAVSILGIAFVVIVGGVFTAVTASDVNRDEVMATISLATLAEAVEAAPYTSCAASSDYAPPAVGVSDPDGATLTTIDVRFWSPDAGDPATGSWVSSCSTDPGLQRITLSFSTTDGSTTRTRDVVKRA